MFFTYISFTDPIEGITAARDLMQAGHFPFLPQLNKLVVGRSDEQWVKYYQMWLLRCDCIFATAHAREHEVQFANANKIPWCNTIDKVNRLQLPPYDELGRRFGVAVARMIKPGDNWQQLDVDQLRRDVDDVIGLGLDRMGVAVKILKHWDVTH